MFITSMPINVREFDQLFFLSLNELMKVNISTTSNYKEQISGSPASFFDKKYSKAPFSPVFIAFNQVPQTTHLTTLTVNYKF